MRWAGLAMARSLISSGPSTFNLLNSLLEQAARANLKTFILERKDGIGSLLSSGADRGIYAANDQLRNFVGNLMALMRKKEAPHATQLITHRERSILEYIALANRIRRSRENSASRLKRLKPTSKEFFRSFRRGHAHKPSFEPNVWGFSRDWSPSQCAAAISSRVTRLN